MKCHRWKHGHIVGNVKSPTYKSWQSMLARCTHASSPSFAYYQRNGITVCDRWRTFENFLADMGERPGLEFSIDRHPNQFGNYEPGNCRWATKSEQANNRATNRTVVYRGTTYTMAQLARATGVSKDTLRDRITRKGWPVDEAVETPKILQRYWPRRA